MSTTLPSNDPTALLPLYTHVASAKTSLSLFNFPPTSRPSPPEIRSVYKNLARALHPDKAPPGREQLHTALFQKVHAAFEDLITPKEAVAPHDAAAGEEAERRSNASPRRIEDSLHARVHDFREWLKGRRAAEVLAKRKMGKERRLNEKRKGGEVSEVGDGDEDVVVEGKQPSVLAGSNTCVARSAQIQRGEGSCRPSRFLAGAGSKVRAEKRLDGLHASRAISTREYERAWMALEEMPEREEEVQGFVDQEPELCEMLRIRAADSPPAAGTEAGQRLITNTVDAEELSEGVAANLGLLLVEVAPSKSGRRATRREKKSQVVDSWEEEEDRLAASVCEE